MTAHSSSRGWPIVYINNQWVYADNHKKLYQRRCKQCQQLPTQEGHDVCLGKIPNVISACCGHGMIKSFQI